MSQAESRLSREIMNAIRARGGFVLKIHGGPLTMAGAPDITGVYRGMSLWIETKMPGEKPTAIQVRRLRQARAAGGVARVLRSRQEAVRLLDHIDKVLQTRP